MDYMDRLRIQYEERLRAKARDDYAAEREQAQRAQIERLQHRERYVLFHGREGAFRTTVTKWTLAAAIISVLGFFGSIGDDGFLKALGSAATAFAVITGIGVIRAYHLVNSVR